VERRASVRLPLAGLWNCLHPGTRSHPDCRPGRDNTKALAREGGFIERYQGMVLEKTNPDYLFNPVTSEVYTNFLLVMRGRKENWHTLLIDIVVWRRARSDAATGLSSTGAVLSKVQLTLNGVTVMWCVVTQTAGK
jgi:hypothetical protein